MQYELLRAFSTGLIIISSILVYYCVRFQYLRAGRPPSDSDIDISSMVWGILCLVVGIFLQSILYLLWDFEIIYQSVQYKLSILPRISIFLGLCFFFRALQVARDEKFRLVLLACIVLTMMFVYILGVLIK